jgi:hypothetical protein
MRHHPQRLKYSSFSRPEEFEMKATVANNAEIDRDPQ